MLARGYELLAINASSVPLLIPGTIPESGNSLSFLYSLVLLLLQPEQVPNWYRDCVLLLLHFIEKDTLECMTGSALNIRPPEC